MATIPQTPPAPGGPQLPKRADNLPLVFQEVLTVIVRLRANRQRVGDLESFRVQIRGALKTAEQEGLRRGYTMEDLRVAVFAIVAFLDESILNSQNRIFADWPRKPLQEELFGVQLAGEIFFRNVERLLGRPDSEALADLLELHQLCLLLGFRGKYSASGTAEIRSILGQIEEKIRRIRTVPAPAWQIAPQVIQSSSDKWLPVLKWIAVACVVLALVLFVAFKISLSSAASELRSIADALPTSSAR
ncbi:MAG: DotU family type IV/VI secretion system protein [Acidobacteriaceae bacterium]|nr:DotU family type IV/VI secretion system protein [Acidobacteriaceae bacterium]MBV9294540.1 DotU family type IV/VI secretion system protein [Acidobacteriaceae bacterium]MBV9765413.1 DotU family type IV/VI secretion system protein [Acidobacteriaceae bacterium]